MGAARSLCSGDRPEGLCLARQLRSGASQPSQMRRPATPCEGMHTARISPPGSDGARKVQSYRSGAAGAALRPGPAGLDRRSGRIHGVSHQPDALACLLRRAHAAVPAAEGGPNSAEKRRRSAVMSPKLAALRADRVVASRRAADGTGPSIEPGRTYAHGTSTGATAAVSCVWSARRHHLIDERMRGLAHQNAFFDFNRTLSIDTSPG